MTDKLTPQQAAVLKLIRRKRGASIEDLAGTFGIRPHTTRALVSIVRRKAGVAVEHLDGRCRADASTGT